MTAVIVDAQRPGIADRIKTCARASTSKTAQPGERRRKIAERSAPRGAGSERPRGCMGPVSGSGMTAPTSINSLVTGRGGDDRFTLVPARRADLIPPDRRLAFASEPELGGGHDAAFCSCLRCRPLHSLLKMNSVDNLGP
jgi:hypothetical protein